MWLFVAFLVVPLIEIALFIQVGGLIGLWPTLAIVVLTAIAGTWLVRSQGAMALGQVTSSFNEMRDPAEPLAHGAMILFSGALLLTPGFFTDAVGFALLMPPVRRTVFRALRKHVKVHQFRSEPGVRPGAPPHRPQRPPRGGDVIEGEYEDLGPPPRPGNGDSGWTRH